MRRSLRGLHLHPGAAVQSLLHEPLADGLQVGLEVDAFRRQTLEVERHGAAAERDRLGQARGGEDGDRLKGRLGPQPAGAVALRLPFDGKVGNRVEAVLSGASCVTSSVQHFA
jgi:hypothetical protein